MPLEARLYLLVGAVYCLLAFLRAPRDQLRAGIEDVARTSLLPISPAMAAFVAVVVCCAAWPYIVAVNIWRAIKEHG